MEIEVSNKITIKDFDSDIARWCSENLVINNPEFYKKQKMGRWVGNTPATIVLYEKVGNDLRLPFGCLKKIWSIYPDKALWKINIKPFERINYISLINPYPYQEKAIIEALRAKNGVLVMPCGSGKTQCGLEIISRLKGTALWLTHTQDLLNQSMSRAKETIVTDGSLGTITAGKVNIGSHITFATVQTMAKLDLSQYKDAFDIIIVDECQRCAGSPTRVTQFYKVVSSLSARYKYGLTATPKRADGLEKSIFALLGDICCEISKEEVEKNTCPIIVKKVHTGYIPDYNAVLMGDGTLNYSAIIDDMIHNEDRFNAVFDVLKNIQKNMPVLVLGNRVEYLNRLCDVYNESNLGKAMCLSGMGTSNKSKEIRKNALNALNNQEIDCIFATYQLAKEGLDIPNLRYVVFATPEKDETTVIQSAGRVGRKFDGKKAGIVMDLVDDFGMYKSWSKKRDRYYKKINAEIIDI